MTGKPAGVDEMPDQGEARKDIAARAAGSRAHTRRYSDEIGLLLHVAEMYYEEDKTQSEIASALNISRPQVSRLLAQARQEGIVQIKVVNPFSRVGELERLLVSRFGLEDAVVVPTAHTQPDLVARKLGKEAAHYLEERLARGQSLGIGRGATVYHTVHQFREQKHLDLDVVPLTGGLGEADAYFQVNEMVRLVAERFGGTAHYLYAPGVVDNESVLNAFLLEKASASTLAFWDHLDWALVGIGAIGLYHTRGFLETLYSMYGQKAVEDRAVGDINLLLLDEKGHVIPLMPPNAVLAISPSQLSATGHVVAVAGGAGKADAIYAALLSGLIKILITDEPTAALVLSRE